MRTIWKFPLGYRGDPRFEVEVPRGAVPLRVDFDPAGELVMWAEVDPKAERSLAAVTVVGTGNPIPEGVGTYVSTFMSEPFVFHAYVVTPS
ncbi:hypothetical protein DC31_13910 [Microbacterium sp. CH12i]|uniref:DUF7352 domain-containing protein n=1 Tax=Microbacterium sp. CH12i TaxID=1479651 RepID=UPI00046120D3|nr:hypothetical protein [Microbacterium sp. CH12i]KDA05562.1 hypothetical protein DC31_13910 [Microbacterium sp. CH12i]